MPCGFKVIYNDTLFFKNESNFYSLDIKTGAILNAKKNFIKSSSYSGRLMIDSVNHQLIYFNYDNIYAFNLTNLKPNWITGLNGHKHSSIKENTLFVENGDYLFKISLNNGKLTNTNILTDNYVNDLFLFGNLIIIHSNNKFSLYDSKSMAFRGKIPEIGQISLINNVLFISNNSNIIAYDMMKPCYKPDYKIYNEELCFGDTLHIGEFKYYKSGSYQDTIISNSGCHTIIKINLTIPDSANIVTHKKKICSGDTLFINDNYYFESGIFYDTIPNSTGCDSIIKIDLKVIDNSNIEIYEEKICKGDSIQIGEFTYYESGDYQDTISSVLGCDSIFKLNLTTYEIHLDDTTIVNDSGHNDGMISIDISGGLEPYSYYWSNGDTTQNIENLVSGNYLLTVTDQLGCSNEYSFFVDNTNSVTNLLNKLLIYPTILKQGETFIIKGIDKSKYNFLYCTNINGEKTRLFKQNNYFRIPNNLPSGIYYCNFVNNKNRYLYVGKLIIINGN